MDVVALAQHGVDYAVATLGTATTPLHVQKLLRQSDEIVFCFDGDEAGRRAAWRALENSLAQLQDGKQVKFLFLPEGEDPDTYVRKHGKAVFEKLLDEAMSLSEFLKQELVARVELKTNEGKAKLLQDAKPLVKQITAPLLSLLLRQEFAKLAGITQHELDREFHVKPEPRGLPLRQPVRQAKSKLTRELIERLIFEPSLTQLADRSELAGASEKVGHYIDRDELAALEHLLEALSGDCNIKNFSEYFRGTEYENLIREAEVNMLRLQELKLSEDGLKQEFADGWKSLLKWIQKDFDWIANKNQGAVTLGAPASTERVPAIDRQRYPE